MGQYKYLYNYCHEGTNVEVARNLRWITDRCNGDDEGKYDDAMMICTNIYKYICIYTTMYNYVQQSLVFSQENFFVGVTMFLLLLICCLIV